MVSSLAARLPILAFIGLILSLSVAAAGPSLSAPEALDQARTGNLTLIDIRTPSEWRQTGIAAGAEAIDMQRGDFLDALLDAVDGDRSAPIALICRTGNRSGSVQRALMARGFTQVYDVAEGMTGSQAGPGWIKRGLPIAPCADC
ncbi:MAG: rhodanese-like domain-containing protein [Chromatiaceae bacterium]|nr:rhodanese-like domain-containing protein [Chromatiaceae bacterium]